jgi:hypothetical protein
MARAYSGRWPRLAAAGAARSRFGTLEERCLRAMWIPNFIPIDQLCQNSMKLLMAFFCPLGYEPTLFS